MAESQGPLDQREQDGYFRELVENLPMVSYIDSIGPPVRTLYVSHQIEEMLGYPVQAWLDDTEFLFTVLHPEDRDWMLYERRGRPQERDSSLVFRVVSRDGRVYTVQSERVLVRDENGVPLHVLGFWVDITDRVRLEGELRQAQKLEAIGRLAGGIAHDFNNILLAQRGYGELALQHLDRSDVDEASLAVAEMLGAAERARHLTQQLLAFARRQVLDLEVIDLNRVVSELERLLRRLIGEDIALVARLAPEPVYVRADRGQLEQVIVNLVINSRDAMPEGGRLELRIATDEAERAAILEVCDEGVGMDEATTARIFDPFFSTKGSQGTGLGLATVHGIVTQTGGRISVSSTPGEGTTFAVVLPAAGAPLETDDTAELPSSHGGGETILLVEDEDAVRGAVSSMLETRGYRVIATRDGEEALEVARRHVGDIDLLLTDLVMPNRGGGQTADLVRQLRPKIGVLYMSGYAEGASLSVGNGDRSGFIQKPFGGDELAGHVRRILLAAR
jgi:two-component system, cell cycle sensor histidine kinase and response regulator CckA